MVNKATKDQWYSTQSTKTIFREDLVQVPLAQLEATRLLPVLELTLVEVSVSQVTAADSGVSNLVSEERAGLVRFCTVQVRIPMVQSVTVP